MAKINRCPGYTDEMTENAPRSLWPTCPLRQGMENEAIACRITARAGVTTQPNEPVPRQSKVGWVKTTRIAAYNGVFHPPDACVLIHASIRRSRRSSGSAPSSMTALWNLRMSNLEPSALLALARSSLIFSSPSL